MYLSLYCKGSKRVTLGFTVRGSWRPNKDCNILTPTLMVVSIVSFSFSRAAQPEAQEPSSLLDDGFLYCILSPTGLVWSGPQTLSGVLRAPSVGCGFPYHILSPMSLISQLFWLPSQSGASRAPLAWCGFPYHISSLTLWFPTHQGPLGPPPLSFLYHILSATSLDPNSSGAPRVPSAGLSLPHLISNFSGPQLSDFLFSLKYIIAKFNRPLNIWNGLFDRQQVEITVMQFTDHSLPVHQSMSVPWEFYLVLFC